MKNRSKQNNKGFTLLEILIAMAILAIIVVPLLHAFVTAATTNAKARRVMRATTAAQNTLEEIKASSVKDMVMSVYGYSKDEKGMDVQTFGLGTNPFEVVYDASSATYAEVTTPAAVEVTGVTGKGEFVGSADGCYNFVFPNVMLESSSYDMAVRMTPTTTGDNVNINSMNRKDCVYLAENASHIENVINTYATSNETYKATHPAYAKNEEQIKSGLTRKITIDITRSALNANAVYVGLKYEFDCGEHVTEEADRYIIESETVAKDEENGNIDAIYLYYYPLYGNAIAKDNIVINNDINLNVNVYLICLRGTDYTDYNEANYRANVDINEMFIHSEYIGLDARDALHTALFSNLESDKYIVDDHNSTVNTEFRALGNAEIVTYQYRVDVDVYKHDDTAFATTAAGKVFTGKSENLLTSFDGSVLDSSNN